MFLLWLFAIAAIVGYLAARRKSDKFDKDYSPFMIEGSQYSSLRYGL